MAEYIDRELTIKEWYKNSRLSKSARKIFQEIPTADVIERSKIDKAIEEINDAPVLFVDFPLGKHQVLRKDVVLAILKRNIGE